MSDLHTAALLGKLEAEIRHLREADIAVREDIQFLRGKVEGLDGRLAAVGTKLDSLSVKIDNLEPSVNSLLTNSARIGYMIAGMGVIVSPLAAAVFTFWDRLADVWRALTR